MKVDILETPSEDVRIEIIPLIDVIFCILTFFILAAVGLTRQQAIDLDLPNASTGNPLPPQGLGSNALQRQRLYVSVDAIGQVYLDQDPVALDLLYDVVLQHRQVSPDGLVVLYASRDARYEDVIQVLDLLKSVVDRVALATLPGEAPNPATTDPSLFDLPSIPSIEDDPTLNVPEFDDPLLDPSVEPGAIPGLDDSGSLNTPTENPSSDNPSTGDTEAVEPPAEAPVITDD